jgi:hypothetical protein
MLHKKLARRSSRVPSNAISTQTKYGYISYIPREEPESQNIARNSLITDNKSVDEKALKNKEIVKNSMIPSDNDDFVLINNNGHKKAVAESFSDEDDEDHEKTIAESFSDAEDEVDEDGFIIVKTIDQNSEKDDDLEKAIADSFNDDETCEDENGYIIVKTIEPKNEKIAEDITYQSSNSKNIINNYFITQLASKQAQDLHELKVMPADKEDKQANKEFNSQKEAEESQPLGDEFEILLEEPKVKQKKITVKEEIASDELHLGDELAVLLEEPEAKQENIKVKKMPTSQDKSWKDRFMTTGSIIAEAAASGLIFLEQYKKNIYANAADINACKKNKVRQF